MAEGLTTAGALVALTALKTYSWAQLHVGAPGASGTANVAAETDRVQVDWPGTVSSQPMSNTDLLEWLAVAGSEDFTHISFWTASTAGTCGMTGTITANAVTIGDTFQIPIGDADVSFPVAS